MKYPTMSAADATKYLKEIRSGESPSPSSFVKDVGSGPRLQKEMVVAAVEKVRAVKVEFGNAIGQKGLEFETKAGELFRATLELPPEVSGDHGFWRYVATVHMYDIVIWRHPAKEEGEFTKDANFGIGGKWENLAARMWYRFEVARDPTAADPYSLCRLGDQDLWRSHILRIRLGASRHVVRSFLKYQYPQLDPKKPRLPMSSKKDIGIRLFIKRLQRYHATTAFEVLTEDDALAIMNDLGQDLQSQQHDAQTELLD